VTASVSARQAYAGPAFLSFGFRPFFLAGGVWAAVAVPVWVLALNFGDGMVAAAEGRSWHIHEMLFGYLGAVVAGFLLTAVPNWTGRLPVRGGPLAGLAGLWLAGRLAMLGPSALAAAIVDSAVLGVFAGLIWREVLAGRNVRNLPVCLMVSLLALANVAFHLRAFAPGLGAVPEQAAVALIIVLIALIGGRIIPSFTRNWLAARGATAAPASFGWADRAALALTAFAMGAWAVAPAQPVAGWSLVAAGIVNAVRMSRWQGWRTLSDPLVWILHAGYAWLALGLLLLGASILAPDAVARTAGVHALTAGAMGVMTLAVMTRATLGHTGRPRSADRWTVAVYVLVNVAAAIRVLTPFASDHTMTLLQVAGTFWMLAFGLFVARYGPMLTGPRAS
jgi:uncharacterized protein involved in response to NO